MKKGFYLLIAAFAVLCICSSCSNEDANGGDASYSELILGSWKLDKEYSVETNSYDANENTIAEFKSDGKVFLSYDDGSSVVINWRIVGSELHLEGGGDKEIYTIKKLDKKEMVLSSINETTEVLMYFLRVK